MANISIITPDTLVTIDRIGYSDLDISSVAGNIWAIQFDTSTGTGTIEYNDGTENLEIDNISDYQSIVDAHAAKKATLDAEAETAAQAETDLMNTYGWKRQREYPSTGDQLDALFHAGVFPDDMTAILQAVKDKYPK